MGWTVTNQGTGPGTVATWTDAVIASPDDNPADGTTIAQFTHQGILAVGAGYTQTQTFLLPPHFEGQYHLFVQTNATSTVFENGNTGEQLRRGAEPLRRHAHPLCRPGGLLGDRAGGRRQRPADRRSPGPWPTRGSA